MHRTVTGILTVTWYSDRGLSTLRLLGLAPAVLEIVSTRRILISATSHSKPWFVEIVTSDGPRFLAFLVPFATRFSPSSKTSGGSFGLRLCVSSGRETGRRSQSLAERRRGRDVWRPYTQWDTYPVTVTTWSETKGASSL